MRFDTGTLFGKDVNLFGKDVNLVQLRQDPILNILIVLLGNINMMIVEHNASVKLGNAQCF